MNWDGAKGEVTGSGQLERKRERKRLFRFLSRLRYQFIANAVPFALSSPLGVFTTRTPVLADGATELVLLLEN